MRKNALLVYVSLILSTFSVLKSQSSDYKSLEEVEALFDEKVRTLCSYQQKDPARLVEKRQSLEDIMQTKNSLNRKDWDSILKFIEICQENHFLLTDYSENEANLDFFQTEDSFQHYLGDHWRNDKKLRKSWYCYYRQAASFFLELENFTEAEKNLVKAGNILPHYLRSDLGSLVAKKMRDFRPATCRNHTHLDKERVVFKKYVTLYANVRNIHGGEFDSIDYINLTMICVYGLDHDKVIEFGLRALSGAWPSNDNPLFNLKLPPDLLKRVIANAHYTLKQFDDAISLYGEVPQDRYEIKDYKTISCMLGIQEKWGESYENFKIFQKRADAGAWVIMDEEEAIILTKVLMEQSATDVNIYGRKFINFLKIQFPSLEQDVELLVKHLKQKQKEKSSRLICNAIAHQRLEKIEDTYQSVEQQYQNLWAHSSLLPSEAREVYLDSFNEITQKIEEGYNLLMSIKVQGEYADHMVEIRELSQSFGENFGLFSSQVKEMNHEISQRRRQLYKTHFQERGFFTEFESATFEKSPSIKAQLLSEQKKKESEAEVVAAAARSKKQERQNNRQKLMPEKDKDQNQDKGIDLPPVHQSSLCSFKDKQLKYLWENKLSEGSENVFEILSALDMANSMFHLRTLLRPGTKLENLHGDREGQISLRDNDQYRICFDWITKKGAYNIELIDYHR